MQEAKGELIVFVDDDNVLDKDHLKTALEISNDWSMLGAWGGQCIPDFETEPPGWTKPFWEMLAIREFNHDRWSNIPYRWEEVPVTAGGCYRKAVVEQYCRLAENDPKRSNLGQKGQLLLRSEDIDLGFTAYDLGLEVSIFTRLKLLHLMPASRLEEQYLLRLVEGIYYSNMVLCSFRSEVSTIPYWKHRIRLLMLIMPGLVSLKSWFMSLRERRFYLARKREKLLGMIELFKHQQTETIQP